MLLQCRCKGIVALIPKSFERVETQRKELEEQERSLVICIAERNEVVVRATIAKDLMQNIQVKLFHSQDDVDKLTSLNVSMS